MAYKMKPVPPNAKLEDLFRHKSLAYRQLARVFFNGHAANTKDLVELTDVSRGSIWVAVKAFKDAGLIYISGWTKPTNHPKTIMPIYRAGNKPDAPKPLPKDKDQVARNKKHRDAMRIRQKALGEENNKYQWKGIAEALVPQRTEQERNEVNRMYLNWLSEGTYG